jgi:serine/threonine protein kinase
MKIVYRGQTIELDQKSPLGTGGEAVVIQYRKLAFKIYHAATKERIEKLKTFLTSDFTLPDNVARPLDLITDTGGRVMGFAMRVVKNSHDFLKLSNKQYRNSQQIPTNTVIDVFAHAKKTLDEIHKQSIIVGDLNDLNILFTGDMLSVFIDVDSYQFGDYPCPVGTEIFLAPELFGLNLSEKPYFTQKTDWYAFAVMLFRSLLFVHPYGGIHRSVKNTFQRIQQRITVFHKDVIYPKIGLPPDSLGDELLDYFEAVFAHGKRLDITPDQLETYGKGFIPCKKCGLYFYKSRGKCPGCQKAIPRPVVDLSAIITKKELDKAVCRAEEIFRTEGIILFAKVTGDRLVIVEYDRTETSLHLIDSSRQKRVRLWKNHIKGFTYEFFLHYLLVVNENELVIFDVTHDTAAVVAKTTTLTYDNEPVIAASSDFFYRLTNTMLLKARIQNNQIIEEPVLSIIENQTWLSMGQNDFGAGFFRIFDTYHYFVFSRKGRYELDIEPLEGRIIEHEAICSINTLCLLRKSIHHGRTFSHLHLIDDNGKVLEKRSEPSLESELLKTLQGKALAGSNIIHPTEAGIVVEKHGKLSLKTGTQEHVDNSTRLAIFRNGIAAISDTNVVFLRMS